MIGVGVVGYGYWGPNLVRNLSEALETQVIGVTDRRPERLAVAQNRDPGVQVSTDYQILVANPKIDAIAICTPVSTHFDLAMKALRAGKHVLVEKPLATIKGRRRRSASSISVRTSAELDEVLSLPRFAELTRPQSDQVASAVLAATVHQSVAP